MDYLKIAKESPEIICWADASEIVLKRNAKTDSVGIKLDTFRVNMCLSFSYPFPDVDPSADLLLFAPLCRYLPPSSPPHPSSKISSAVRPTLQTLALIQSSTSFSQDIFCCSSHTPDTCPHPVLHILLPRYLLLFVPLSRRLPSSSPPHPSPKISLAFLCFAGLSPFLLVLNLQCSIGVFI